MPGERQHGDGTQGAARDRAALVLFLAAGAMLLWRSLFTGRVFLPAGLLTHIAPYSSAGSPAVLPLWNPLRWDSLAQFYPWRLLASRELHHGVVPLWNPYQFCGTPLLANGQSAVLYPGNLLFWLLPPSSAFAWSALLHLFLCSWFTYLLLRKLQRTRTASVLGALVFTYCAWQVAWLQLPTFLCTACWIPILLRQLLALRERARTRSAVAPAMSVALVFAAMLLAGHLQIAFYGVLAALLWVVYLCGRGNAGGEPAGRDVCFPFLGWVAAAAALGLLLACSQLLPTFELSRLSARSGGASAAGYTLYTGYAAPPSSLASLTLPDIFGSDTTPANPFWQYYTVQAGPTTIAVRHNQAETAIYVGILPLALALLAMVRLITRKQTRPSLFFVGLALVSLLLAFGTPLDALLYFGVPGFSGTGSPGRILMLWSLAAAGLAAIGLDELRAEPITPTERLATLGALGLTWAVGLSLAARATAAPPFHGRGLLIPTLHDALARIPEDWARLVLLAAVAALALAEPWRKQEVVSPGKEAVPAGAGASPITTRARVVIGLAALTWLDLYTAGAGANPSAPQRDLYPTTPGIRLARTLAGHNRVQPVNRRWSLLDYPPSILPPNGATVFSLRDVQGYDSLFWGAYKGFANGMAVAGPGGVKDSSPPEVGNMVFAQDPTAPNSKLTGATLVMTLPTDAPGYLIDTVTPAGSPAYMAPGEMALYNRPEAPPRARLTSADGADLPPPTYTEDAPTRVSLRCHAAIRGELLLADENYPGWRVDLDGRPARMTASGPGGIFRSVAVPPGAHKVDFRFQPASFGVGLYLSCAAAMVITGLLVFSAAACASKEERMEPEDL